MRRNMRHASLGGLTLERARRAGQAVFAVTIDQDAHSYLPSMFGRYGFAIVGNIAKLPRALPAIYRGLIR
jgi:nitric oxide reductase NorD protein